MSKPSSENRFAHLPMPKKHPKQPQTLEEFINGASEDTSIAYWDGYQAAMVKVLDITKAVLNKNVDENILNALLSVFFVEYESAHKQIKNAENKALKD